ncbi:DUF72 domain-containing protein [Jiella sp. MQZ9-1]|uniref:DUF72 domain-containing protein n=1 Tax=Jiella flava TaxID=2816857 RepID=A0A939JWE0_9HYPH|nr:DUF72 domain-containing protein [Jiella flava]MBO0662947.1 DUF72 domain-containing protein [Jiella flava]MCD2471293.1 DUF72 domain-containing protein [Jiella flava]
MTTKGTIRTGIGGWTFDPWNETFYPADLAKTRQLAYAASKLTSIEVNGTFYRSQSPATYAKWASAVPTGFVFSLKAPRFAVNRKVLSEAGESIERFVGSGIVELGDHLGPILWQFAATKSFDANDFSGFLKLLPKSADGVALRHVVEPRHSSFNVPQFVDLCKESGVAIVCADSDAYPQIADVTADFAYLRLQRGDAAIDTCYPADALDHWAARLQTFAAGGEPGDLKKASPERLPAAQPRDVFAYFIRSGKPRAPHGAMALTARL